MYRELRIIGNSFLGSQGIQPLIEKCIASEHGKLRSLFVSASLKGPHSCLEDLVLWLDRLIIANAHLNDEGAEIIANALLKKPMNLTVLSVASNNIKEKGLHCLAMSLKSNAKLRILNLSYNEFKHAGAQLYELIVSNRGIKSLSLKGCSLEGQDFEYVARSLQFNNTLIRLDLCKNHAREHLNLCFKRFAENLPKNSR